MLLVEHIFSWEMNSYNLSWVSFGVPIIAVLPCDFDIKRVKRHVNNSPNTCNQTCFFGHSDCFTILLMLAKVCLLWIHPKRCPFMMHKTLAVNFPPKSVVLLISISARLEIMFLSYNHFTMLMSNLFDKRWIWNWHASKMYAFYLKNV